MDDYPAVPKYVDELKAVEAGGSGELDEGESLVHFEKWRQWRRESRRPPVEDAPPETPWVGSKEGMYVTKVPTWLSTAYKANVLKANNWRDKPARFVKDNTEFELITGHMDLGINSLSGWEYSAMMFGRKGHHRAGN